MSGSSKIKEIVVLCPNGRRVTIKQSVLTSIGQIIEEACVKHGFDPYMYNLKHLNRPLDPSSTLQYSNIPNHAQLELVDVVERRKEGCVTVNLVTDTGQRLIADFPSNSTLWDILIHHKNEFAHHLSVPDASGGQQPFIVYTMRKVIGEDLKTVTLKSLGLFGGRCMMRYNIQSLPSATCDSKPIEAPSVIRSKVGATEAVKTLPETVETECSSAMPAVEKEEAKIEDDKMDFEPGGEKCEDKDGEKKPPVEPVVPMEQEMEDNKAEEEKKVKEEKVEDKVEDEELLASSQVSRVEQHNDDCKENVPVPNVGSNDTKCHEEISEQIFSEQKSKPKITSLCSSHDALLFSLDEAPPTLPTKETEDFFTLTVDEVRGLYREHVKELRELDDAPLMTHQLRQLEKDSRLLTAMNRHPVTQIRVCFPDRYVIQANFKPRSTVREVMQFIGPFLHDKGIDFYLYTTFPRTVLSPELSLVEAGCIPKARLYFGSDDHALSSSSSFLSQDTILKKSSFEGAAGAVIKSSIRTTKSDSPEVPLKQNATAQFQPPAPPPRHPTPTGTRTNSNTNQQKPKWFKLGK